MPSILFSDLGLMPYQVAWDYQEKLFAATIQQKMHNREHLDNVQTPANYLLFCEHPHVYTLGKTGSSQNMLLNEQMLKEKKATFVPINRGGDITYHGPGQLVAYPILDLDQFFTDIHLYLRNLEETVILTLREYGIEAGRYTGYTGVWLDADKPALARKICAMGVRCSRWVTMHGLAFNLNTDLSYFGHIIPCGISDKKVTSLKQELGKEINADEVKEKMKIHFAQIFKAEIHEQISTSTLLP